MLFFRIFVLQMFFYGISTIGTGVLQAHRHFFLPTFAPVLNNLIVIASFVAYYFLRGNNQTLALYVLALGVTVGVAVMALALVPTMLDLGYRPRLQFGHPALLHGAAGRADGRAGRGLRRLPTLRRLPGDWVRVAGGAQLRLHDLLAPLRHLRGRHHDRAHARALRKVLSQGCRWLSRHVLLRLRTMAFVVIPSAVGMVSLSEPIVGLLYERGIFDPRNGGRLRAARGLRGGAARLLGVLLPRARFLLAAEHEDPCRVERRHLLTVCSPRLRALPRLGHNRRGARARGGLHGACHPELRGDAPRDGKVGRPAPPPLLSQGTRLRGRHVRRGYGRNVARRRGADFAQRLLVLVTVGGSRSPSTSG